MVSKGLVQEIRKEWQRGVPDAVTLAARDIADSLNGAALAVLFYGSCLRTGDFEEKILDFYVIVENYKKSYKSWWLATANRMLPPNVFYHEMDVNGVTVRSKYAVLSRSDLTFRVSKKCLNVSVWARFCQPCLLMHARDEEVAEEMSYLIAQAAETMIGAVKPLVPANAEASQYWIKAFQQTYASELRSESRDKGREIYMLDQERYDAISLYLIDQNPEKISKFNQKTAKLGWFLRRINGKWISFLRLVKATTTFDGGIDYLAWKIGRHSGVTIEIKPWMRKHPIIAGLSLFWTLRVKGAFR